MKKRHYLTIALLKIVFISMNCGASSSLLEEAKYTEQILGDIEQASLLYQQAIDSQVDNQRILAQAMIGLANCQALLGKQNKAKQILTNASKMFSNDSEIYNEITNLLETLGNEYVQLLPPPWKDGETLEYKQVNSFGVVNDHRTLVWSKATDPNTHEEAWLNEYLYVSGRSESIVYAKYTTQASDGQLIHQHVGEPYAYVPKANLTVNDGVVILTDDAGNTISKKNYSSPIYAQDDVFGYIRRLPYEQGYSVTLPVIAIYYPDQILRREHTLTVVNSNVEITTELGTFTTFEVESVLKEGEAVIEKGTIWITNDDSRQYVKAKYGFEELILVSNEINGIEKIKEVEIKKAGLTLKLPPRWRYFDLSDHVKPLFYSPLVYMGDNGSVIYFSIKQEYGVKPLELSLKYFEEDTTRWYKNTYPSYVPRSESFDFININGYDALSYVGDMEFHDVMECTLEKLTSKHFFLLSEHYYVSAFMQTHPESFENMDPVFNQIVNSIEISSESDE